MKNITLLLAVLILLSISVNLQAQKKKKLKETGWHYNDPKEGGFETINTTPQGYENLPKKARYYFEGMKYVEGGTFTSGRFPLKINATDKDSTLLINNFAMRISIGSYFISDHEVTNAEYREFTNWVKTKTAMDILAKNYPKYRYRNKEGSYNETMPIDWNDSILINELFYTGDASFSGEKELNTTKLIYDSIPIYPDTLCWTNDFPNAFNEPMTRNYFWHPAYDNYPVVGVSWKQANAYCHWRTERLNEDILIAEGILKKYSYYFNLDKYLKDNESDKISDSFIYPNFKLPTKNEWEYAAVFKEKNETYDNYKEYFFPWENNKLTNEKGEYQANFGKIVDLNGYISKDYKDDGFLFSSPVKTYPANSFGLYDMSGNVAEWVIDVAYHKANNKNIEEYKALGDYSDFNDNKKDIDTVFITSTRDGKEYHVLYNSNEYKLIKHENDSITERNDSIRKTLIVKSTDSIDEAIAKIKKYTELFSFDKFKSEEYYREEAINSIHNAKVIEKNPYARVVKGGSWADGPVYIIPETKTIFSQDKSSSRIGFRIAMDKVGGF